MHQSDIFDFYDEASASAKLEKLKRSPIATKDDVLRALSEVLLSSTAKHHERIKAAEVIAKISGFADQKDAIKDDSGNVITMPTRIEIVAATIAN